MMWFSRASKVGPACVKSMPAARAASVSRKPYRWALPVTAVAVAEVPAVWRLSHGTAATAPTNKTAHTTRAARCRRAVTIDLRVYPEGTRRLL